MEKVQQQASKGKKAIVESHGGVAGIGAATADDVGDANGEDKASQGTSNDYRDE